MGGSRHCISLAFGYARELVSALFRPPASNYPVGEILYRFTHPYLRGRIDDSRARVLLESGSVRRENYSKEIHAHDHRSPVVGQQSPRWAARYDEDILKEAYHDALGAPKLTQCIPALRARSRTDTCPSFVVVFITSKLRRRFRDYAGLQRTEQHPRIRGFRKCHRFCDRFCSFLLLDDHTRRERRSADPHGCTSLNLTPRPWKSACFCRVD